MLVLTADKYFVLRVVRNIGVHRDCGYESENFSEVGISKSPASS